MLLVRFPTLLRVNELFAGRILYNFEATNVKFLPILLYNYDANLHFCDTHETNGVILQLRLGDTGVLPPPSR